MSNFQSTIQIYHELSMDYTMREFIMSRLRTINCVSWWLLVELARRNQSMVD